MRIRLASLLGFLVYLSSAAAAGAVGQEATFTEPGTQKSGKYTLALPSGPSQGLLAFFHGSGGGPSYASTFEALSLAAAPYHLATLAIQAPNGAETWPEAMGHMHLGHVAYVNSLLEQIVFKPHPEINRQRVVFVGLSAGSTFLAGDFLPSEIIHYAGGVVLLCGGGPPLIPTKDNTGLVPAQTAQNFKFFYYIQTGDFLFRQAQIGLSYWRHRGVVPTGESPQGVGHCSFDFGKVLTQGLRTVLGPPG